jgi:lipid A 3-O-deacylase
MKYLSATIFLSLLTVYPAMAEDERTVEDDKGIFNVVIENDIFAGSDSDYTNGIRFSWLSSEERMPAWSRSVADVLPLASSGKKRISIAAGQSMFAPADLTVRTPPAGEQPYAAGFMVRSAWYRIPEKRLIM